MGPGRRRQDARVADGAWAAQLYAVRAAVQQANASPSPYVFSDLTRVRIETYCRVRSRDGVQAKAAVRKDGRTARGATLLEAHVDVGILSVEEALAQVEAGKAGYSLMIIETSEPGSPAFDFRSM